MSLRLKIVVALMLLASAASVVIGLSSYRSTRAQLLQAVDQSLDTAADAAPRLARCGLSGDADGDGPGRPGPLRGITVQVIDALGEVINPCDAGLEVNQADRRVAGAGAGRTRHNGVADGEEFRVLTVGRTINGTAVGVQFARPLTETNTSLEHIARRTLLAVVMVIAAAALVGWWIGHQITRRLGALTAAARRVETTGVLDLDVAVGGRDEVATLGTSMRAMLGALAASRAAQHQLVQDAGHELRTPLTSLRTNVAVLRQYDRLPDDARRQILADLDSETRELTTLVNELVELATDQAREELPQHAVLGDVAQRVADRSRRRSGRQIVVTADASAGAVRVAGVERAITNLVDNAVKFAPDGPIEVTVRNGRVAVRDHGPGLPAGEETRVFERFYRAVASRSLPGSGLGLSIVASVAAAHGGTVFAANAPGGGAEIGFTLPTSSPLA